MSIKQRMLEYAEVFDAWRVFPRLFVVIYGVVIINLGLWFSGFELQPKMECNFELFQHLTDIVKVSAQEAQGIACSVVQMVGGPTTQHTAFATSICGLSTAIFAFYVNTGRKWKKNEGGGSE